MWDIKILPDKIIIQLLLVGLIFSVICHGHSRKLVTASVATAFLACFAVIMWTETSCQDCGMSGIFWLVGFPVYFCMSVIVGLIYKIIHHKASNRIRMADNSHKSAASEALPSASNLIERTWKIAFWIIFTTLALRFIDVVGSGTFSGIWDWLDAFATTVAIIGFYSYAYRQNIGHGHFWKVFAVFFIGWDIFINSVIREPQKDNWIGFLIFLPMYMALFLYGFRSRRTEQADVSTYEFSDRSNQSEENI